MKWGFLPRWGSAWVGVHYSKACKRYCINIIPCLTIWIAKEGGEVPNLKKM